MKKILYILSLIFVVASASATGMQDVVRVETSCDSLGIFIGQQTGLHFNLQQDAQSKIASPLFSDTIVSGLEIVEILPPDTTKIDGDRLSITQSYIVTAFDSALIYVPEFAFVDENNDTTFSNPVILKVFDMPIDTTEMAITPIKDVVKPPFDWATTLTIACSILLIAVLVLVIYLIVRKLRRSSNDKESINAEPVDNRPAHEIAFEALNNLQEQHLCQQAKIKEHYTALSEIIRAYIDRRFNIDAMEMTSDQIVDQCKLQAELRAQRNALSLLQSILSLSDLVKFAKWQPANEEHERTIEQAYEFVDKTKVVATEPDAANESPKEEPTSEPNTATTDHNKYMPK